MKDTIKTLARNKYTILKIKRQKKEELSERKERLINTINHSTDTRYDMARITSENEDMQKVFSEYEGAQIEIDTINYLSAQLNIVEEVKEELEKLKVILDK